MPRIRVPMDTWIKNGAKAKHTYIPKGQKEVGLIFAHDVVFIDTVYLPGHEPEPEPTPIEETPEEEVTEKVAGPTTDWSKKKLIKEAKKAKVYTKKMEDRKFTKAMIVDAINKSS